MNLRYRFQRRSPSSPARRLGKSRRLGVQNLEHRQLLAALPYGATEQDTAEFMLGDVLVNVVLFESDGSIDANTENWTPDSLQRTKDKIVEGLEWWETVLDQQDTVHDLNFHLDFTFADEPVVTGYEPVTRRSDDFLLWFEDFFDAANVPQSGAFDDRVRTFNHQQRVAHGTHWAFTIFVVNSSKDTDGRFADGGTFSQAFAFAGGRFFVTLSDRPASTIAHESAHMFWAMDEYAGGGKTFTSRRGYYNTQNLNAFDGHPNYRDRVPSILDSHSATYTMYAVSETGMETIGWKDSDGDGIFDVLDVAHQLEGTGHYDPVTRTYGFAGSATVQTLPNRNNSGSGNDITINRITGVEYRFDEGVWQTAVNYDAYVTDVEFRVPIPMGASSVDVRVIDDETGVVSNLISQDLATSSWQNAIDPLDVDGNRYITPLDALLIINELNGVGPRLLTGSAPVGRYLDVNGDDWVTPMDALVVINRLNQPQQVAAIPAVVDAAIESVFDRGESEALEPPRSYGVSRTSVGAKLSTVSASLLALAADEDRPRRVGTNSST